MLGLLPHERRERRARGEVVRIRGENGQERARFAELVLTADHFDDAYEGRSLVLYVSEPGSEERLAQQTYAFEHGEAVENVFGALPDGHGFTGIHYHYSEGGAELQYYCGRG